MAYRMFIAVLMFVSFAAAHGQWLMQDSHTNASLRGIHSVDGSIAWASGTNGTVLRTQDGGTRWEKCAIPPGAEKLDFRGVWAWNATNALVMSAGPGDQSRLYRTTDGCVHWTEERRNEDKNGFWDAIVFSPNGKIGVLLGDPVQGRFHTETTSGKGWTVDKNSCPAQPGDGAFAASNSSIAVFDSGNYVIGSGGKPGPRLLFRSVHDTKDECPAVSVPLASGSESAGVFSVAFRDAKHAIVVGGDYKKPDESSGTAAWSSDGGLHWTSASKPPHGFRSAVTWYADANVWIAAGTNGSDVSRDGGKTWQPLDDGNWNALSLPFIVGPNGRIGKVDPTQLSDAAGGEEPLITVRGPTIVAFSAPVTDAEMESSPDTNEALADFQLYAAKAREPLQKAGVDFYQLYVHSFRIKLGGKTTIFRPGKINVGYYFVAPGKKPRVEYGVNTDTGLIETARQYFGIAVK